MNILINKSKAFGLLEVLISGTIILIVLGALIFAGRSAMANSEYTQERAAALYLAQQGIEQVRQIRDTNWIDGDSNTQWDSIIWDGTKYTTPLPKDGTTPYHASLNGSKMVLVSNAESVTVNQVPYTRKIILSDPSNLIAGSGITASDVYAGTNAIKITVQVDWPHQTSKGVTVSEILTNWRPDF